MKDIDKAAREYAERIATSGQFTTSECVQMAKDDFIAGAQSRQSEIDELIEALEEAARWISVSERLPFYDKAPDRCETIPCLIKTTSRMLMVAYYDVKYECWNDDQDDDVLGYEVAFWRPIDTPKATQLLEKYGKK